MSKQKQYSIALTELEFLGLKDSPRLTYIDDNSWFFVNMEIKLYDSSISFERIQWIVNIS